MVEASNFIEEFINEDIAEGKTVTYSPMTFPGDYRNALTPTIQKLFANEDATVRQLADILNEYWRNNDPLGR